MSFTHSIKKFEIFTELEVGVASVRRIELASLDWIKNRFGW